MIVALTIVCGVACAALVFAEWRQLARLRVIAKIVASLAFFDIGMIAGRDPSWIVLGLGLGVVGDIALLGRGKPAFLVGLGAFLLGHVAYVIAFARVVPIAEWATPLAALPVAVAAGALAYLWPHLGSLRVAVIAYVIVIVAMVAGALAIGREPVRLGALLFFASDLSVARDKFVAQSFANKAWGLPAYYAGQLLIAWSLAV